MDKRRETYRSMDEFLNTFFPASTESKLADWEDPQTIWHAVEKEAKTKLQASTKANG
jgi:hypothetical protein